MCGWRGEKKSMCQTGKYIAPRRGGSQYFVLEVAAIVLLILLIEIITSCASHVSFPNSFYTYVCRVVFLHNVVLCRKIESF